MISVRLAFTSLNFVTTEILLCLGVGCVLSRNWVVLFQCQFSLTFGGAVLGINSSVVSSVVAQVTHQTNQLSYSSLPSLYSLDFIKRLG